MADWVQNSNLRAHLKNRKGRRDSGGGWWWWRRRDDGSGSRRGGGWGWANSSWRRARSGEGNGRRRTGRRAGRQRSGRCLDGRGWCARRWPGRRGGCGGWRVDGNRHRGNGIAAGGPRKRIVKQPRSHFLGDRHPMEAQQPRLLGWGRLDGLLRVLLMPHDASVSILHHLQCSGEHGVRRRSVLTAVRSLVRAAGCRRRRRRFWCWKQRIDIYETFVTSE